MRAVRSICSLFFVVSLIIAAVIPAAAGRGAELLRSGNVIAPLQLLDIGGVSCVPMDVLMSRIGFACAASNSGFVASSGKIRAEFFSGTSVVRVNSLVVPLMEPMTGRDGHWWVDMKSASSAANAILGAARQKADVTLRMSSAAADSKEDVLPQVKIQTPETPPVKNTEQNVQSTDITPSGEAQGIALMTAIRWGLQENAYRAVIDVSSQVDVKMTRADGVVEAILPNTVTTKIKSDSPWSGYSASASSSSSNAVIRFTHRSKGIKWFWLTDPPRFVIDFIQDSPEASAPPQQNVSGPSTALAMGRPRQSVPQNKRPVVVIDAGHGGHDPGALGNSLKEKDINLQAALELEKSIKALGMDARMSRRTDVYLKLGERTEFANSNHADIFISLHCNALPKGRHARGTELYIMADSTDRDALNLAVIENREISGNAQSAEEVNAAADKRTKLLLTILGDMQQNDKINESTNLAEILTHKMKSSGISIRSVRQAPFFVLRGAGMPAILVEMGYITEKADAQNLRSQAHRKKMMDAIARGIQEYLKRIGIGG